MCGYHSTVHPWIAGDREARETMGLTKEDSGQLLMLRYCILRHCFEEHASRMRLIQTMKESEIQNVELPTWYVMESKGGKDWLRPSHPMTEERDLEEQDVV
jgi:hypothetical protein